MTERLWQPWSHRNREALVSSGIVRSVWRSTLTPREALVRLHRYASLIMALFLAVAGVTGSVIAFHHELDEWLNPELYYVTSYGAPLPPLDVAAWVGRFDPRARATYFFSFNFRCTAARLQDCLDGSSSV